MGPLVDGAFAEAVRRRRADLSIARGDAAAVLEAVEGTGLEALSLRLRAADATGDPASNKTLSSQRAGAVKQMLTNAGIAADRLQAEGYGQERPIASNDTETGRARNRRLELVVVAR